MTQCSGVPGAKKRRGPAFSQLIAVPVALARRPVVAQPPTNRGTPAKSAPSAAASSSSSSAAPRLVQTTSYTVRGTLPSEALSDADRNALLQALEADTVAQSTAAARASAVRTWSLLHLRWFGLTTPVIPVSCDSMRAIAAQMKSSGYRSFPNYVTALKALHKKEFPWSGELDDCRRECEASTQRGIGPTRQSLELPVSELSSLGLTHEPLVPDGPACPALWATLSAFHVVRGAESACALASSLRVCTSTATETWSLPISKTDPQAVGCQRSWGCVCSGEVGTSPRRPCPYHAALDHMAYLAREFGNEEGLLPAGLPLFPNCSGGWCTRAGFIGTIAALAARLKVPTTDDLGRSTIGEHVWRISGSRHLAALDVPIPIIKLLARWGSDTVMRYIADAPLSALTRVYLDRVRASDDALKGLLAAGLPAAGIPAAARRQGDTPACLPAVAPPRPSLSELKPFVVSATGKVHLVSLPPLLAALGTTKCPCGWNFVLSDHRLISALPPDARKCLMCAPRAVWLDAEALAGVLTVASDSD